MRCWRVTWPRLALEPLLPPYRRSSYVPSLRTQFRSPSHLTLSLFQWPDNYDFGSTRALNNPLMHSQNHTSQNTVNDSPLPEDEKRDRANTDAKDDTVADTRSASDEPIVPLVDVSDLDPVALKKAFKFAAWSSVALVRSTVLPSIFHPFQALADGLFCI